ncbi:kinesin-domain-containing protein [Gigaspora margarita]|uniref:Kinesin-domain-containing protein n=1 Tax=Gigaspora margarita TaxID=4874 RepID=A0A8H3XFI9_GIGMA|nr:kinesin-domain-containing protein [Gigaspora margarita]
MTANINTTLANRARNIKNSTVVNQEETGWQNIEYLQTLILKLRAEIKALKNSDVLNSPLSQSDIVDLQQNYFGSETTSNLTTDSIYKENKVIQILEEQLIELLNSHMDMSKKDASLNMYKNTSLSPMKELAAVRGTVRNAEMLVLEQEMKMLLDAEELNNQDIRLINDLRNNISNHEERKKPMRNILRSRS